METDFRPFPTSFTMPTSEHEQPYGMPSLHTNPSTFADNAVNAYSSILASGSAIGNPGQTM